MSSDKDEDGNHKNCTFNYFRVIYCSDKTDKKFQEKLLFLNKKSIYYTNLHKKGKKVTTIYVH